MVSVCLPSDALLQHLPSYLGFPYLGRGVSLHSCSSKAQPLLLTLEEGYLLTTALPDLQHGIAPLGPPASTQPPLLGCGVAPPGHHPWPQARDCSSQLVPQPQARGGSSWPLHLASDSGWLLPATTADLWRGVAPLGRRPLRHGVLPASAPDLRRGVAPLTRA